jgi:hypothetical protein
MADPVKDETPASEEITLKTEASPVLSGITEVFLDGKTHYGVAVNVTSGSGLSTLMIPDITGVSTGQPVYITRPIVLEGAKLKAFFTAKKIMIPETLGKLIEDTSISCDAFYYSKDVMLFMFAIKFDKGVLTTLTGDASLGELFEIKGASLRVINCPKASFDILQKYVAALTAESA